MKDVKINKVYGTMWTKVNEQEYSLKMLQVMSELEKNYILEL